MKLRNIIKFSSDRTVHRLSIYILTILLCFVMFLLLLASWFSWRYIRYERYLCNQSLNGGIEQCGMFVLESDNAFDPNYLDIISELEGLVGFTSCDVYQYPVDEIRFFGEQQIKLDPDYYENSGFVPWFLMNESGVDVCHFNLQEGKKPEDWNLKNDEILIYLGGNFENVTVGERYKSKREACTYVVGGVFEKGTNWIYDDVYRFETIQDSHYVQCLDNMVVCLVPYCISGRNTYCVEKGYQIEDVEKELLEISEKYNITIRLARLEDVMEENEYQFSIILNLIRLLTFIIIIASLFVLERTQYTEIINDTEYFGILYANGATSRDLTAILFFENLLKLALSFVLAVIFGYFILRLEWNMFDPEKALWDTVKSVYVGQAILPSMLIGVGLNVFSTIRVICWLEKKSAFELLQNHKM